MRMFDQLAGSLSGRPGDRAPIVLLHGLTFDRRQFGPLRRELAAIDPDRQVLSLDLPGHGESPDQPEYGLGGVARRVAWAVDAAGLRAPVLAGHSIGAVIATELAARFPARAVLNLDQPLLPGPFGALVRGAEATLRGPEWRTFWDRLRAGMGVDELPAEARELVALTERPRADLLLGYWGEILRDADADIRVRRSDALAGIAARGIGYHWVTTAEPPTPYAQWLSGLIPGIEVTVLPGGHFPHLDHAGEVAKLAASL